MAKKKKGSASSEPEKKRSVPTPPRSAARPAKPAPPKAPPPAAAPRVQNVPAPPPAPRPAPPPAPSPAVTPRAPECGAVGRLVIHPFQRVLPATPRRLPVLPVKPVVPAAKPAAAASAPRPGAPAQKSALAAKAAPSAPPAAPKGPAAPARPAFPAKSVPTAAASAAARRLRVIGRLVLVGVPEELTMAEVLAAERALAKAAAPPEAEVPADELGLAPHAGPEPQPGSYVDRGKPVPDQYGMDRLVAMARDPQWVFCYWELSGHMLDYLRQRHGDALVEQSAWVLRLHRFHEHIAVDVEIEPAVGNWYIHVGKTGEYQCELGLLTPSGEFHSLLASQVVVTPPEGPSSRTDEDWRLDEEEAARLYEMLSRQLGLGADAAARGTSGFVGASRPPSSLAPSSFRFVGSFFGGSGVSSGAASRMGVGGALTGRAVGASWITSFMGASGRPGSMGSGGFMNVGWLVGVDGSHQPILVRPAHDGGPNWHLQANLPHGRDRSKTAGPDFKVKLPRVVQDAPRPVPGWPPAMPGWLPPTSAQAASAVAPVGIRPWAPAPAPAVAEAAHPAEALTLVVPRKEMEARAREDARAHKASAPAQPAVKPAPAKAAAAPRKPEPAKAVKPPAPAQPAVKPAPAKPAAATRKPEPAKAVKPPAKAAPKTNPAGGASRSAHPKKKGR